MDDVDTTEQAAPAAAATGVESVDRVLAEVSALAETPVAEHVAVFERAHTELRRALDGDPGASADEPSD